MKNLLLKFGLFLSIPLLLLISWDYFIHSKKTLGNTPEYTELTERDLFKQSFILSPDLELLNVQNRAKITLKQICRNETKLAFRYFATDCKECIFSLMKGLQKEYDTNFISEMVLLNDSYIKTYSDHSTNLNEYYIKSLDNKIDKERVPYFFIINPNSDIQCNVILVCDMNNLELVQDSLKSIIFNHFSDNGKPITICNEIMRGQS